jgi:lipoprotein-anchoring transpeptidase ErfK/SrfK
MRRNISIACVAGVSVAALIGFWPADGNASVSGVSAEVSSIFTDEIYARRYSRKSRKARSSKSSAKHSPGDKPGIPEGPRLIVVSIDNQRVSFYANGTLVRQAPVSTGTKTHPTPMGVFSILQKNRHHISNLYYAPMPYMQRITWSGSALHQGALPGYPASHGCIRLPGDFAQFLWGQTKIGARVIITRGDTAPVEINHPRLLVPKDARIALASAAPVSRPRVKTVDGSNLVPGAVLADVRTERKTAEETTGSVAPAPSSVTPPEPTGEARDTRVMITEAVASLKDVERRTSPVSVFISRKEGKLFVRQGMEPLFETPVTIRNADQPIGTHVYTAMGLKAGSTDLRWTSVSIPSGFARENDSRKSNEDRKRRKDDKAVKPAYYGGQVLSPTAALDRIDIPQDALDSIGPLLTPGSSLIVSDNGISGETGKGTDFIVLTR